MPSDNTITLKKPLTIGDSTIARLTFRDPVGDDLMTAGYPLDIVVGAGGTKVAINAAAAGVMMSRLAEVPPSTIKKLSLADFNAGMVIIAGFFMDSVPAELLSVISNAAGSTPTSVGRSA